LRGAAARLRWGELGRFGLAAPFVFSFFLILKLEIHFEASYKIGKMQIRYCWIRCEKFFNMGSNLKQKYKLYKTKI
jgi:hypothetical protein